MEQENLSVAGLETNQNSILKTTNQQCLLCSLQLLQVTHLVLHHQGLAIRLASKEDLMDDWACLGHLDHWECLDHLALQDHQAELVVVKQRSQLSRDLSGI